jgi:hypothetical protein
MTAEEKARDDLATAAELCERVAARSEPKIPVPQSGAVQRTQLGKRVLQRFDETISGVRAYATVAEPAAALKLLRVLSELQTLRSSFEVEARGRKLPSGG